MMLRTTDNNGEKGTDDNWVYPSIEDLLKDESLCYGEDKLKNIKENLLEIGNKSIKKLKKGHPDLLVFPDNLEYYKDGIGSLTIFSMYENTLRTYNLMGFIGRNDTQLTISSRFAENDKNDYFLHYMVQKVFCPHILKLDQTPSKENIWDFLLYLFPYYLKKAYSQGLYKAYRREEYNDANLKGAIDVKRHICINIPFAGKIAYTTREHRYDNHVTQLIRHTIEYIKVHPFGSGILTNDSEIWDIVSQFCFVTQNRYNRNERQKVINANLKPVTHPYFTEYKMLQKICLRILRREKITFGQEKDKIYGLLFDGAWLWEEYLNKVFEKEKLSIEHPKNKAKEGHEWMLVDNNKNNIQKIYPDFIHKNNQPIVADAKYKHAENNIREDVFQIIAYMYRFKSNNGLLLFPHAETNIEKHYTIKDTDGKLIKLGLGIPKKRAFHLFKSNIKESEDKLIEKIKTIITTIPQTSLK
jgi:5-methylcytosine-specific restriction endonuclease McrBC regulatory subunit McrC